MLKKFRLISLDKDFLKHLKEDIENINIFFEEKAKKK